MHITLDEGPMPNEFVSTALVGADRLTGVMIEFEYRIVLKSPRLTRRSPAPPHLRKARHSATRAGDAAASSRTIQLSSPRHFSCGTFFRRIGFFCRTDFSRSIALFSF